MKIIDRSSKSLYDQSLEHLQKSPLRVTKKRRLILKMLVERDCPVSAADLRATCELPDGDLVTVYRTLEAFVEVGIAQRIPLENGSQVFEAVYPGEHFHHVICRNCHRVEKLNFHFCGEYESEVTSKGFTDLNHLFEIYGLCPNCR